MKESTGNNYRRRLCRVLDYIHNHLDQDLDVNALAEVALMSPYHFHRIYRQMANETVNATVRRLRLQKAASDLIRSNLSLDRIAKDVAYSSAEAFIRAFSKEYGESPAAYRDKRQQPSIPTEQLSVELQPLSKECKTMFNVEMMEFETTNLLGYEHKGDYMEIGNAFDKLFMFAGSKRLIGPETRSIGIYYSDPGSVDTSELRSHACISVEAPRNAEEEQDPENLQIPAGRCATLLFKGPYAELEKPYNWFFGQWLPQSGLEAADFPPFEEYLNDPRTTAPSELLTRIHCLLK